MHRRFTKKNAANALKYLLLLAGGAVSVMPMVYMVSTSLKPNGALYEFPPRFFPSAEELTAENYQYIFAQEKFYQNFLNSAAVTILTVLIAASSPRRWPSASRDSVSRAASCSSASSSAR